MSSDNLLDSFKPLRFDDWKSKAIVDLKGQDFDKKLKTITPEGLPIQPFYTERAQFNNDSIPGNKRYKILESVQIDVQPNFLALKALQGGAEAIHFNLKYTSPDFGEITNGIHLDIAPIYFTQSVFSEALKAFILSRETAEIHAGINLFQDSGINSKLAEECFQFCKEKYFNGSIVAIHANLYREKGLNILEESAVVLAQLSELLQLFPLEDNENAWKKMIIYVATGSNYFFEIARLKSLRLLIKKVLQSLNISLEIEIVSVITKANKSFADVHNNILRATSEAMSSILGGADAVCFSSFDLADENNLWKRTITRNIFHLLNDEAYLLKNADPAEGSFYLSQLQWEIKEKVWQLFLEIEQLGSFSNAIEKGWVDDRIRYNQQSVTENINHRKTIVLGANQFPDINDRLLYHSDDTHFRWSSSFEQLRFELQQHFAHIKHQPIAYLWQLGKPAMRKARAIYAYNFFACVGISSVESNPDQSISNNLEEIIEKNPDFLVFCSDNDMWQQWPQLSQFLPSNTIKILAGNPAFLPESVNVKDFDLCIFEGCDVLNSLKKALKLAAII